MSDAQSTKTFGIRVRVKEIKLPTWVQLAGGRMCLRWALSPWDPEYPYNWIKREIGVDPEDFGVHLPTSPREVLDEFYPERGRGY